MALVNSPASLDVITAVRARLWRAFEDLYVNDPGYTDYKKFVFDEDPAGDVIWQIYSEPGVGMREWIKQRPETEIDYRYFTHAVRTFADGVTMDLDDIKPDAGNPMKLAMYLEAAERVAEGAVLLWPGLVAEAIVKGLTALWLPDGQHIFDVHYFNPGRTGLGQFRNYFSKTSQGGSAAMPLTYGNLLARVKGGYTFILPNGKEKAIRYTHLVTGSALAPTALRLCKFDNLPVGEVWNQNTATSSAGGETANEIKRSYNIEPIILANMPANCWMLVDASTGSMRAFGLKKRQDLTWQQLGPGPGAAAIGMEDNDSGAISEVAYDTNKTKWGVKARGECFFRQWWGVVLCDGTP